MIILLIAFGSVVAMSVPIGTALFGLGIALSIISLVAAVTEIGTVAPTLATMIGLGVGIDYSLFIVTRHRQNLAGGMEVNESIGLANGTAGQAVLFAGGTVVIAITGSRALGGPVRGPTRVHVGDRGRGDDGGGRHARAGGPRSGRTAHQLDPGAAAPPQGSRPRPTIR